jgi:hypothetical protein
MRKIAFYLVKNLMQILKENQIHMNVNVKLIMSLKMLILVNVY